MHKAAATSIMSDGRTTSSAPAAAAKWVKLRVMSASGGENEAAMSALQRPLLSEEEEDSGLHGDDYNRSVERDGPLERKTTRTTSAAGSDPPQSLTLFPSASTSPARSVLSDGGDKGSRKKKLVVWADVNDGEDLRNGSSTSPTFSSPDALLPHEVNAPTRPQSYILFEGREGEEEGYIHVKRDRSRSSFLAGASVVSEGDITEDQFDYKADFIKVEVPSSNPDGSSITTAQELLICKRTVLKPFLIFLKLIGWRSFFMSRQDINPSRCIKALNILYPFVLFSLLVLSCATQVVTCFYRDQPVQINSTQKINGSFIIDCSDDLFTRLIFPDLLLLFAYVWGIYIFRFGAPEHVITLVETVFLSSQGIHKGQAKMVNFMRLIMVGGLVWVVVDFCFSIVRVFSLQLLQGNSYLSFLTLQPKNLSQVGEHTPTEQALRFTFVIYDFFGFIFFDLLYIAAIVTYTTQCQLVRLYIGTIIDKVLLKLKGYTLEQAMADINKTYKFLQVVNGKLSVLVSICLLVFIEAAASSLYAVFKLKVPEDGVHTHEVLGVIVGVGNIILWCFITLVPIVQASRLTSRCQQLRRLGLSVGHRPFAYHNTPQLLLDSFVQYTSITRYRAKLAGIPVYPSFVIGGTFLAILLGSFIVIVLPITRVAPWF